MSRNFHVIRYCSHVQGGIWEAVDYHMIHIGASLARYNTLSIPGGPAAVQQSKTERNSHKLCRKCSRNRENGIMLPCMKSDAHCTPAERYSLSSLMVLVFDFTFFFTRLIFFTFIHVCKFFYGRELFLFLSLTSNKMFRLAVWK